MKGSAVVIALLMVLTVFITGYALGQISADDDHSNDTSHSHMSSEAFTVSASEAPSIREISVSEDIKSGWNIEVVTEDFTFTPEKVGDANVVGEGHAHLYVDGEKVARLYGNYYHWDGSFDGTKEFLVTLNGNDHGEYTVEGERVEASISVTHSHSE